jgi:hypothetical protein
VSSVGPPATPAFEHLKPRYSIQKVCEIFDVDEVTLRRWLREGGVPLEDGRRIKLPFIPLGLRNKVFLKEEVERVFLELVAAGDNMVMADVIDFPVEERRPPRRSRSADERERSREGKTRRVS